MLWPPGAESIPSSPILKEAATELNLEQGLAVPIQRSQEKPIGAILLLWETKEERQLIPGICFSIEPGIYLEGEMAVRTEIDVFITLDKKVVVAGDAQEELILLKV